MIERDAMFVNGRFILTPGTMSELLKELSTAELHDLHMHLHPRFDPYPDDTIEWMSRASAWLARWFNQREDRIDKERRHEIAKKAAKARWAKNKAGAN